VLDWVVQELHNPATNALVLFGQRRIGKTSVLLQLQRRFSTETFLPVYFDLQDQAVCPLGEVLADLVDTIAEQVGLRSPEPDFFDNRGRFFRRTVLPGLYRTLGESRRLVFLLDEFDVLDPGDETTLSATAAGRAFFPFLRSLMTEDNRPAFVFVVGRRAEDLSLDFTSTFKASLVREIWVLDRESAKNLVRQAEVNGSLRFTDDAVGRILRLSSNHPYLTQLLCQRIWELAYRGNPTEPPRVDLPEVEAAIPDALAAGDQALRWLWDGLAPAEKIYASALAEIAAERETITEDRVIQVLTAHAARLRTREVELAPRDLVKRRVLEVAGERHYRFAVELFRRWARLKKPISVVKDELDRVVPMANRLYEIGLDFFNELDRDTALRYFQDALQHNPRHFRARLHLGETLLELGRTDDALAELEQAYELDREAARLPLARALVIKAKSLEEAGDEEGALTVAERVLRISANEQGGQAVRAAVWTRRGDSALERDDLDGALTAYQKSGAIEKITEVKALLQRRLLEALEAKAQTQMRAEQWVEAATVYEQLLAQAPDEESQVAWQTALEGCREEDELARLFAEGKGALEQRDWKRAQRALADLLHLRPNYERNGQSAAGLLEQAVSRTITRPMETIFEPVGQTVEVIGFTKRLAALSIDFIILTMLWVCRDFGIGLVAGVGWSEAAVGLTDVLLGSLSILIFIAYYVVFWATSGQTPGKMAMRIKVIRADGSSVSWGKAFLRFIGYIISSLALSLGFVWAAFDAKRQGWHDKIAGTYVVHKDTSFSSADVITVVPSDAGSRAGAVIAVFLFILLVLLPIVVTAILLLLLPWLVTSFPT
jgi:uncharacterized RDD family membrane protein YckC